MTYLSKKISDHARREKSIRYGHISTLHIWWARRPLAACRAVICAALWPDPADSLCPQEFRNRAATLITKFAKKAAKDKDLAAHCSTGKIAQGLGAHLQNLRTLIEVKGDKDRLLPVSERAPYLFGKDQGKAPTKRKKKDSQQLTLFTLPGSDEEESTDWGETAVEKLGNTVLDRIHLAKLLTD